MQITKIVESIPQTDGLTKTLGMEYISTDDPDTIQARMKCTDKNKQPWGYLSGGATIALAENLAGIGSMCVAPGDMVLGINVCASHIKSVALGHEVLATARLQHRGRTLHQWHVEVTDERGDICSTIQVTNFIIANRHKKEE